MIGVIDYGMSNLKSVINALDYLGCKSEVFSKATEIRKFDKVILPGVGSFSPAMKNLEELGFVDELRETVLIKKKPILGICLGMQLLLDKSYENGECSGLGILEGEVLPLEDISEGLVVPHMGWNNVSIQFKGSLFGNHLNKGDNDDFYFVHSYYCKLNKREAVIGQSEYGSNFDCAIEFENIYAVQFHPEKSHSRGLKILSNFANI